MYVVVAGLQRFKAGYVRHKTVKRSNLKKKKSNWNKQK
jgi:hypothetical protein